LNPLFQFIFQNGSPENMYYRWRVYSLMQGDTLEKWRVTPFCLFAGGPLWVPPSNSPVTKVLLQLLL
jgi:U2-associated protein SR140